MSENQQIKLSGQCLCGEVCFEISGEISSFHLCYCSRCRHITGSAHAANMFTAPQNIVWLKGEPSIKRFELAGAKSFANQFCCECGSRLPFVNRAGTFLVIPAGSINDEIPLDPNDRIFTSSQAKWTTCIAELPTFETYPDKF
jgi:hypothetical protein